MWQKRQSIFFNILSFKNNGIIPCSILPTCLSMLLLTGFDWILIGFTRFRLVLIGFNYF